MSRRARFRSHSMTTSFVPVVPLGTRAVRRAWRPRVLMAERPATHTVLLQVGNLKCGGCAARAEEAVRSVGVDKVSGVSVSPASRLGLVTLSDRGAVPEVLEALQRAGYPSAPHAEAPRVPDDGPGPKGELLRIAALFATAAVAQAAHCGVLALGGASLAVPPAAPAVACTAAVLCAPTVRAILSNGVAGLARLAPTMDSLVALAAITGFVVSAVGAATGEFAPFFGEQVALLAVVSCGRALEASLRRRAAGATEQLVELQPTTAMTADGQCVLADRLEAGDSISVGAGERFPVDSRVAAGTAEVDAAIITGESAVVQAATGDEVAAGCLNVGTRSVLCTVLRGTSESYVAQVRSKVQVMQASKLPSMRIADAVVGRLCWAVIAASLATFVTWFGALAWSASTTRAALARALGHAVSVLVVACPCALGLASPMAIYVAAAVAARRGIHFRSAAALERLAEVRAVAFDKTGTLTSDLPDVVRVAPLAEGLHATSVIQSAAGAELTSTHPIGRAIVRHARTLGWEPASAEPSEHTPAGVSSKGVHVGDLQRLVEAGEAAATPEARQLERDMGGAGDSVVAVASGGALEGLISLRHSLVGGAAEAIATLQARGTQVWIVSGDSAPSVRAVGALLLIPPAQLRWRLRPEDKVDELERIRRRCGGDVAAVGDGFNDALLLRAADVGIGVPGSTAMTEAAADVLCTPAAVPTAVAVAAAVVATIRQNLVWAVGYNAVLVPLAAGVLAATPLQLCITPPMAAAAMSLSSLAVLLNSLRLIGRLNRLR